MAHIGENRLIRKSWTIRTGVSKTRLFWIHIFNNGIWTLQKFENQKAFRKEALEMSIIGIDKNSQRTSNEGLIGQNFSRWEEMKNASGFEPAFARLISKNNGWHNKNKSSAKIKGLFWF